MKRRTFLRLSLLTPLIAKLCPSRLIPAEPQQTIRKFDRSPSTLMWGGTSNPKFYKSGKCKILVDDLQAKFRPRAEISNAEFSKMFFTPPDKYVMISTKIHKNDWRECFPIVPWVRG